MKITLTREEIEELIKKNIPFESNGDIRINWKYHTNYNSNWEPIHGDISGVEIELFRFTKLP